MHHFQSGGANKRKTVELQQLDGDMAGAVVVRSKVEFGLVPEDNPDVVNVFIQTLEKKVKARKVFCSCQWTVFAYVCNSPLSVPKTKVV